MNQTIIGTGFNSSFFRKKNHIPLLQIPNDVTFIEGGISELSSLEQDINLSNIKFSLHLARTPITECANVASDYIPHIAKQINDLPNWIHDRLVSVGIHLTGSRFSGIGLLGAADAYIPNDQNLERASRFLTLLHQTTGLPIWLENANFYSKCPKYIIDTWRDVTILSKESWCGIIFDVAHAIVEANNNGISPDVIIGCVPWEKLAEVHLSGITLAKDGSMHDGHNHPIPESVWNLFSLARHFIPNQRASDTIYTIEHTPPTWADKSCEFHEDFAALRNILSEPVKSVSYSDSSIDYMRGYLRYLISGNIPYLEQACTQRNIHLDYLILKWLDLLEETSKRVIFTAEEVTSSELEKSVVLLPEFLQFAKAELKKIEHKHI